MLGGWTMTARAVVLLVAAAACGGAKKQAPRPQEPQMDPEPEVTAPTEQFGRRIMRVPRPLIFALGKLSEYPLGALGRQSPLAMYRSKSALARLRYDSDLAHRVLGWQPRVGAREGIRRDAGI
jgi:hypothetical protein